MSKNINNKTTKPYKNYLVSDEELLYRIADAGLLDKLRGVSKNKYEPDKRVYFFDRDFDVKQIIYEFVNEKKSQASQ